MDTVQINIRISRELNDRAAEFCRQNGYTLNGLVRMLLDNALDTPKRQEIRNEIIRLQQKFIETDT